MSIGDKCALLPEFGLTVKGSSEERTSQTSSDRGLLARGCDLPLEGSPYMELMYPPTIPISDVST